MSDIAAAVAGIQPWQTELYQHLHAHPELSHQEVATAALMAQKLREFGFEVTESIGGTGLIGVLRIGDGPTVLMRADMDALPVTEKSGLPYASTATGTDPDGTTVDVMHACGHDFHMSWLLGAAAILSENRDWWSGTYIALFQPSEEHGDGALAMVHDGLAQRCPTPDVVLGQHVMGYRAGWVLNKPGPMMAQSDSIRITVHGRGAHGSMPHAGVDPAVLVAAIVMRLQTVVAREISPFEFGVVTVGVIRVGSKSNIIAADGELQVNIRSYDPAVRARLIAGIERIVRAECEASDCPAEPDIAYFDQVPLTTNDEAVAATLDTAFAEAFGDDVVPATPFTGSEDFSQIATAFGAPYNFWFIGGWEPDAFDAAQAAGRLAQDIPTNHSPFFVPALQPTLTRGTEAALVAALAYLGR